jgi:hypothetical protein
MNPELTPSEIQIIQRELNGLRDFAKADLSPAIAVWPEIRSIDPSELNLEYKTFSPTELFSQLQGYMGIPQDILYPKPKKNKEWDE